MTGNVSDAVRHLEKDMADILDVMNDKNTTEVILNPYRKPSGHYEGHILVDQHGTGLNNLIRKSEVKVDPVALKVGDWVIFKYSHNNPENVDFWVKFPSSGTNVEKNHAISNAILNYFDQSNSGRVINQINEYKILEFAGNIEDGYINNIELTDALYSDPNYLISLVNSSVPVKLKFSLGIDMINSEIELNKYEVYPSLLIKNEIIKMSATRAETIMSVLASITKKFIHSKTPYLECQIPKYGHRFTGTIPPASNFPAFCIRKHAPKIYTLDDFVTQGILQETSRDTIRSWIKRKLNILIAGGTGSGKTTLANAILQEINVLFPQTRILIIEDVPELQFNTSRSIAFTIGEFFSMYEALRTTLRFKPERIVMGEVRGSEAYTLLKAWNTGHPGGLATIHANGVEEALHRFESCVSDHPGIKVNRQELGFTINGIISIQNLTVREMINGEFINVIRRKVTGLRQIMKYDVDKDIYQDIIFDKVEESFE